MQTNLEQEFSIYYKNEKWAEANLAAKKLWHNEPNSFWIATMVASTYYELKEYDTALKYSLIAFELNPKAPIVLWHHAGILYMLHEFPDAIDCYKMIISYGIEKIAFKLTLTGVGWAKSLISDTYFKLSECYYQSENDAKALEYINLHLESRRKGQKSIVKLQKALHFKNKIIYQLSE